MGRSFLLVAAAVLLASCAGLAGLDEFVDGVGGSGAAATGTGTAQGGAPTGSGGQDAGGGVGGSGAQAAAGGVGGTGGQGAQGGGCAGGTGRLNGECCSGPSECASDFCVEDVCCDNACNQRCDTCTGSGSVGTCTNACVVARFGENSADDHNSVTIDTRILSGHPLLNHGGAAFLTADKDPDTRILIRFAITALPAGASIDQATLYLYIADDSNAWFGVHPILEPWQEGTGDGNTGVANWVDRTTSTAWANSGCDEPGSSSAKAMLTFRPNVLDQYHSISLDAAVVQSWLDTPSTNFGVTIRATAGANTNGFDVDSSEGTNGRRPYLSVTYRP